MNRLRILSAALGLCMVIAAAISSESNADQKSSPTFNKDVAPILYKNCIGCHRSGEIAPMSLVSYKEARPWARSIREKVATREMPPWYADPNHGQWANDPRLSQKDINTIVAWVEG